MDGLPGDVLGEIFGHFDDLTDMIHLAQTCRGFWAKYVEIRAKLIHMQSATKERNYPAIHIIIKNYRFEIAFMHTHPIPLNDFEPTNFMPFEHGIWSRGANTTMDICLRRDKHALWVMIHTPYRSNDDFSFYSTNDSNFTKIASDQIKKYFYCYNTFLKNANIDQQYKDFFLAIPEVLELLG